MAYQKTPSYKIPIDDQQVYARSILAAAEQGKTLAEFATGALANAIHVHDRQKHHNAPREDRPAPNSSKPPTPPRLPPKPR